MTYKNQNLFYCLLISIVFLSSCQKDNSEDGGGLAIDRSRKTSEYKAELAQQWMETAYNAVKARNFFALDASRLYAYVSITMYESMVHGIENGRSLEGQLDGLRNLPKPDPNKEYDWAVVMCHATPLVMVHMLNEPDFALRQSVKQLEVDQEKELLTTYGVSNEVILNSKNFGKQLADAIIAYADADRAKTALSLPYNMPGTNENPQFFDGNGTSSFFMAPFWWTSRPLAIKGYQICEPDGPYPYSEDPNSIYYQDVKEVFDAVKDPEKLAIGQYWANNPGVSGTPAGSWVGIANQLIDQQNLDLITSLKMYTLLTISTRDVFIVVWYTKYKWNLQRPVSYIRKVLGDAQWLSPVPTPPYPDYVSGTSANGGSSSTILTRLFGAKSFTDNQHEDKGFAARKFDSFEKAGIEAFHSRIYAGVHMRKACEDGFKLGQCVANGIFEGIDFEE